MNLLDDNITSCILCFAEMLQINKFFLNTEGRKTFTGFSLLHLVGWLFLPITAYIIVW